MSVEYRGYTIETFRRPGQSSDIYHIEARKDGAIAFRQFNVDFDAGLALETGKRLIDSRSESNPL